MKRIVLLFSLALFSAQGQESCSQEFKFSKDTSESKQPYNHLAFKNDPCLFQFAIVTDRTGGHRPGVFMDGVNKLNLMQPEFVMSVGDLIEGYTLDTIELRRQWAEFESFVDALQMPFFYVPGNHDITNAVMEEVWLKRFGATYYHFIYKDVLFLCLNSEDQYRGAGRGTISDDQFEYIRKVLEEHQNVRWTLLFMHQPLWHQRDTKRWTEIEALLAKRSHTVYAGHEHRYVKDSRNNGKYFTLATTGGGSSLRGAKLGEFDHMMWVTMSDDGPIMANLDLQGIWSEDVVTRKTKDLIERYSAQAPIEIEPVFYEEGSDFHANDFKVKVTNDENVPMLITIKTENSPDLALFSESETSTIPPNSHHYFSFQLLARDESLELPAKLNIEMRLGAEDEPALIEYPFHYLIKPVLRREIFPISKSPVIDGSLADWKPLRFHFERDSGSVVIDFDLSYDDEFLYVGARVKDDVVQSFGEGPTWKQDNLSIVINANKANRSAVSTGYNWYLFDFVQQLSPANDTISSVFYRETMPDGSKMVVKTTELGYEGELALPISYLESLQGEPWQSIRFNIGVDDKDQGPKVSRYSWQPAWRDQNNFVGSGTFFKAP